MNKPIARIYQRVSTEGQELTRQQSLREEAEAKGYMVVATYSEKASGTSEERPELLRMMADLNPGDTIIAEHLDRITRLPLDKAEDLMALIESKGAKVSVPGLIDLPAIELDGLAGIVFKSAQDMLRKIALYSAVQTGRHAASASVKASQWKGKPTSSAHQANASTKAAGKLTL